MKQITLNKAHEILTNCSAVVWQDYFVCRPGLAELTGDEDNQWCYLSSDDSNGFTYSAKFEESNNRTVKVEGSSMFLMDNEDEEVQITVLVPTKLED